MAGVLPLRLRRRPLLRRQLLLPWLRPRLPLPPLILLLLLLLLQVVGEVPLVVVPLVL